MYRNLFLFFSCVILVLLYALHAGCEELRLSSRLENEQTLLEHIHIHRFISHWREFLDKQVTIYNFSCCLIITDTFWTCNKFLIKVSQLSIFVASEYIFWDMAPNLNCKKINRWHFFENLSYIRDQNDKIFLKKYVLFIWNVRQKKRTTLGNIKSFCIDKHADFSTQSHTILQLFHQT